MAVGFGIPCFETVPGLARRWRPARVCKGAGGNYKSQITIAAFYLGGSISCVLVILTRKTSRGSLCHADVWSLCHNLAGVSFVTLSAWEMYQGIVSCCFVVSEGKICRK